MLIEVSEEATRRLQQHAAEAGYDSVEKYASDHLLAIAQQPVIDELPPMTEEELQHSAALCDQGMEDAREGRTMSVEEARQRLTSRLGKQRA